MTHGEVCRQVAKDSKVPEETVRKVLEAFTDLVLTTVTDSDQQLKVKDLGSFYGSNYKVHATKLEFGGSTTPGDRRRIRFRPFDSTNTRITQSFLEHRQKT